MIADAQYIDGKVALRYDQPIPKLIKVGTENYTFVVRLGISICLVDESIVSKFLEIKGGCCNRERKIFKLASFEAANLWRTGTRDGIVK